ncbi:hypothetical protein [Nocardia sp. NPDC049707]|uniref:hypothetical protein n=1 Tax=Nocardia sp. NPDC049707 TaxID=3154735 RepID=UPI00343B78BE
MKQILGYIDRKQTDYENHAFFTDLLDNAALSGNERLAWAPSVVPFIMGYSDLNKYVFRDETSDRRGDPLQKMLNTHTYEEDFHWQWMLDDLSRLGADTELSLSDSARVLWSPDMSVSRRLCLKLAALTATLPVSGIYAMVEAIEAVSVTIFKHCQGITLEDGQECEFFGTKHYLAEAGHLMKTDDDSKRNLPVLDDSERAAARAAVDDVFSLFDEWSESLMDYARRYSTDAAKAWAQIIAASQALPHEVEDVVIPRF